MLEDRERPVRGRGGAWLRTLIGGCLVLAACASPPPPASPRPEPPAPAGPDAEIFRRADALRAEALTREVKRLRADLKEAEQAIVEAESGMRSGHTRADAVSTIADARIQVDRMARSAPWRLAQVKEARAKLEEADRQLAQGHIAAAAFFASRAQRIAADTLGEARQAEHGQGVRSLRGRVNFRESPAADARVLEVLPDRTPVFPEHVEGDWVLVRTPDGRIGWVHASLLRDG